MNISRRSLAGTSALGLAAILLAGCNFTNANTITVTLEAAQQQALATWTAIGTFLPTAKRIAPSALWATINTAYTELGSAITAFTDISSAKAVLTDISTLLAIPAIASVIPAGTALAIEEGITLIKALISGIGSISVPAPTPATVGIAAPLVVQAPIPIPLS